MKSELRETWKEIRDGLKPVLQYFGFVLLGTVLVGALLFVGWSWFISHE